jgi:iron complex transport system substrate-binding protein
MSGDTVTITGEVKRIINLWPAGTSSFFAMGAGELIVGVAAGGNNVFTEWVRLFYPDCVNIPVLGSATPSIEDIIKLEPDLVIIHPTTASSGFPEQVRAVGIPVININFIDYETMVIAYTMLGEILGGDYQQKLNTWCRTVESKIANVRRLTANLANDMRPVVYYIAGQSNSMTTTMTADSIFSDWVESAGGKYAGRQMNLTVNTTGPASQEATPEAIFAINPDVIICGGVWQHVLKNSVETTPGWRDLNAVKNNRVYNNPYACFNWDRYCFESLLQMHYALMCIQPDVAQANGISKETIIDEAIDFYKTYTNFELSRRQAEYMLVGLGPNGTAEIPVQ